MTSGDLSKLEKILRPGLCPGNLLWPFVFPFSSLSIGSQSVSGFTLRSADFQNFDDKAANKSMGSVAQVST